MKSFSLPVPLTSLLKVTIGSAQSFVGQELNTIRIPYILLNAYVLFIITKRSCRFDSNTTPPRPQETKGEDLCIYSPRETPSGTSKILPFEGLPTSIINIKIIDGDIWQMCVELLLSFDHPRRGCRHFNSSYYADMHHLNCVIELWVVGRQVFQVPTYLLFDNTYSNGIPE